MGYVRRPLVAVLIAATLLGTAADAVGDASAAKMPSDDAIFQTIKEITSRGPRRPGSAAGEYAVGYVRDQFKAAGLSDVHVEETPTFAWEARANALKVGGKPVSAFPVAYSQSPEQSSVGDFSTPAGGLDAPLVDGGLGTPADLAGKDVKGKIVVFDLKFILPQAVIAADSEFLWDPDNTMALDPLNLAVANPYQSTYATAIGAIQDAGAAGFIGVLADYFDSNRYYNEYYRSLNVKMPGMWVTKKVGAEIRSQLQAKPDTHANIALQTHKAKVMSHVVVGYLPGKSKDSILVTSHHDSVWEGAVEDGSGASEVIALAKYYGSMPPGKREKSLMFATFDSHFSGYQAHDAFAYRHVQHRDPKRDPYNPVAVVAIEHIAKQAKQDDDGKLYLTGLPEPRGVFENLQPGLKLALDQAIVNHDLRRTVVLDGEKLQAVGIPTDANWALLGGLPLASFISGPEYLYDEADTLDKVQKDDLQRVALTFADLIDAMDTTPVAMLGLPPVNVAQAKGPASVDAPADKNYGGEEPKPACTAATAGRPVSKLDLRRTSKGRSVLTFHARRNATIRIEVRSRRTKSRRIEACRDYRINLGMHVRVATVRWPGGSARVR